MVLFPPGLAFLLPRIGVFVVFVDVAVAFFMISVFSWLPVLSRLIVVVFCFDNFSNKVFFIF